MLANLVKQVCRVYFWKDGGIHLIQEEEKEEKIPPTAIQDGEFKMAEDPGDLFVRSSVPAHQAGQAKHLLPSFLLLGRQPFLQDHQSLLRKTKISNFKHHQFVSFNYQKLPNHHHENQSTPGSVFWKISTMEFSVIRWKFSDSWRGFAIALNLAPLIQSAVSRPKSKQCWPTRRPKCQQQHWEMSNTENFWSRYQIFKDVNNNILFLIT